RWELSSLACIQFRTYVRVGQEVSAVPSPFDRLRGRAGAGSGVGREATTGRDGGTERSLSLSKWERVRGCECPHPSTGSGIGQGGGGGGALALRQAQGSGAGGASGRARR